MIRYFYLPLEKIVNNINMYDLTRLDWNLFRFKRGVKKYKLTQTDTVKFYMLMEREYDNLILEDWIYYINRIPDPLELEEGQEIVLPSIQDIQDFLVEQLGVQS